MSQNPKHPARLWMSFADCGEFQPLHIRQWQSTPFDGGFEYVLSASQEAAAPSEEPVAWQNIERPYSILTPEQYGMRLPLAEGSFRPLFASPAVAPVALHSDDAAVDRFAAAMKAKLAKKREEGRGGWDGPDCSAKILSDLLRAHVDKGDPLDLGNLAMMLHQRGERII
jgi:hypothetical protein